MFDPKANSLQSMDKDIFEILEKERVRQEEGLELIASENYTSLAVMQAQGSVLTNKYAEGYPSKRYYGGCEIVDQAEQLAIDRVKKLFKSDFANVQPHSGSQANMAVYFSALSPGDKILGMDLSQGGHLTHGSPVNFSGKLYNVISYGLDPKTERIDYNKLEDLAKKEKPKMIVAGASAYPRIIDFELIGSIAKKYNCLLLVDMAHIAGLIAAGVHPSPVGHADFVTSTTHKTLRGPRGGIILTQDENWAKKVNSNIFPGIQGGPLEHVIAAKAVAFHEALQSNFIDYQKQVLENTKALENVFNENGIELVSGGSDNHLLLIKTDSVGLSGKDAENVLSSVGITTNKNMIPGDKRSAFVTSGVRIGTAAITTRAMKQEQMVLIGQWMVKALKNSSDEAALNKIKQEVLQLCAKFPVYPGA